MAKETERETSPKKRRLDGVGLLSLTLIALSLCLSFARLLETPPFASANDRSRWVTVWSLVEGHGYVIDEAITKPGWDTIDKVRYEGHFYSSKPPLFSTIVAGVYWLEKATLGWSLEDDPQTRNWNEQAAAVNSILVIVNLIPWGLALWVLYGMLRRYAESTITVILVMLVACWATLLTPFLTTLNNHVPAAICVILALDAAMRITINGSDRWWWFSIAGAAAAFACCFELPAAAFGVGLFGLLVWKQRQATLSYFVPAAVVPIAAFFVTNGMATGGIRPFYMFYGTETYEYVHEGVPSYWINPRGIDQNKDSPATYLLHCTIGHHGLFSLSPILLLVLPGWVLGLKRDNFLRDYMLMGLALTLVVLGYFLTRTENYNYGGNSVALRWLLWLVPFWLIALVPVADRFQPKRWFSPVAALLLLPSVFSAWYPWVGPWTSPWLYTLMERWDWIDYSDPRETFDRPVHSWLYLLPDGPRQDDYWVELSSIDSDGRTSTLRLSDYGPTLVNDRLARVVNITQTRAGGQPRQLILTIDVEAFRAGAPIQQFLVWPRGRPSANADRLAAQLLSGLPEPASFNHYGTVYRKSHVRKDAFEVILAVAGVRRPKATANGETRDFQCRAILSHEAPFGILRYETHVYAPGDSNPHAIRRWTISNAGKFLPRHTEPEPEPEPEPDSQPQPIQSAFDPGGTYCL